MPTYMTPGVYVEEPPSQSKPIEGVGTSVAAFVGLAPYGPENEAVQCSNWGQFARVFGNPLAPAHGPFMADAYLAHAVYGYFHNGGNICWVVRVGPDRVSKAPQLALEVEAPADGDAVDPPFFVAALEQVKEKVTIELHEQPAPVKKPEDDVAADGKDAKPADAKAAQAKTTEATPAEAKSAAATSPEANASDEKTAVSPAKPVSGAATETLYQMVVRVAGVAKAETHDKLSLEPGDHYIANKVNAKSKYVRVLRTDTPGPLPKGLLFAGVAKAELTTKEEAEQPQALIPRVVEGDVKDRKGLGALAAIDAITMVCVPDIMTFADGPNAAGTEDDNADWVADLQGKMVAHCDEAGDRMAILDPPPDRLKPDDVFEWQQNAPGLDSKFATLYYPWIQVLDPVTGALKAVPPCGHVAGVWARTDGTRGVHKAPANEVIQGATALAFDVTHDEQGELNRAGINCIRSFPGRGIRIWGARTLSSDPEWRYINVRRLFNFVSESILEGTQWAVFEPNDPRLWTQLRIAGTNFLTRVWRDGALMGATPGEAFYVKCDAETNPPDLIEAGQVTVEIGIAPVKPAEFIVFRISQFQAGEAGA